MALSAARAIVFETSHHAQLGSLDDAEVEVLENLVTEAIAVASSVDPSAVASIARRLYWKLNPLGTVPSSFYDDANFRELADRIIGVVISELGAANAMMARMDIHLTDYDLQNALPSPDRSPSLNGTPYSQDRLKAISAVLVSFIDDLSGIITVKPEFRGREAEAIHGPARVAAERLSMIAAGNSLIDTGITSEFICVAPEDWAQEVVAWLLDKLESSTALIWSGDASRAEAVSAAARKVMLRITTLVEREPVLDNSGNLVKIDDAQGWTRSAAADIYQMLLDDDFKPYRVAVGMVTKQEGAAYLQKSIFENVYPAIIFRKDGVPPVAELPAAEPTPAREGHRREQWKMPWSVARDIVDDLCSRSGNETAFLATFKDWLGTPDAGSEEVRNELISEILARGRQSEVSGDIDMTGQPAVSFVYENWRGEIAVRKAVPVRMTFGSNEWHKDRQWLMEAFDLQHQAMRTFALGGIIRFLPAGR